MADVRVIASIAGEGFSFSAGDIVDSAALAAFVGAESYLRISEPVSAAKQKVERTTKASDVETR